MASDLPRWPPLRVSWWVYALACTAVVLFPVGLVVRVRCGLGRCNGSMLQHLFDLDSVGGLPRLFTTGLFAAVAALAWWAARQCAGDRRTWWTAVSGVGAVLALAKLVSAHSVAKSSAPVATLLVSVLLAGVALVTLTVAGRRWNVPATRPVVIALGVYAAAALGLDAITAAAVAAQSHVGALTAATSTFIEESGEAATALLLLVTVRWHLPARSGGVAPAEAVLQNSDTASNAPEAEIRDDGQSVRQQ